MLMDSPLTLKAFRRTDSDAGELPAARTEAAPVDDGALMLRYRDGDQRAFEILYLRHKGALYRYLQRMCRNREACNDLFQEVWSKVITSRDRYEVRAQFSTFLFRIAHNCAVDYFRRAGRQHIGRTEDVTELEEQLPGTDIERPDEQLSEAQLRESFKIALDNLPAEQRNVFVLYEETGMTLEQIGEATGVGFETAKSRLRYALSKLRHALKHYDPRIGAASEKP
jgi:RNA polymerase sigma-70 factor (ECF subfamily)